MSSQFKVKKVTKAKGPSDLSGKVSASETRKDFSSKSNRPDRPQGRGSSSAKNSTSRDASGSTEGLGKSKTAGPTGPKPTPRGKPSAQKQKAGPSKACPAQESKKSDRSKGASSETQSPKPVPRPRALGPSKSTAAKSGQPRRDKEAENRTTNINASDSDSERGSSGALNAEGDIGYGSGSFDDSDLSNNELLSPSAKEENKKFAPKPDYSYATVEFRPLIITDGGGVAAPVDTRNPEVLRESDDKSITGDDCSVNSNESSPGDSSGSVDALRDSRRRAPLEYEQVEVIDGEYDRSNVKFTALSDEPGSVCENDTYSTAADEEMASRNDTLPKESTCPLYISDIQDVVPKVSQIYAAVQKPPKQDNKPTPDVPTTELAAQEKTGSLPPAIPPRPASLEGDFNTYKAITGELQSMIQACDGIEPHVGHGRPLVEQRGSPDSSPQKAVPPPIPKPYAGPGPFSGVKGTNPMPLEDETSVSYVEEQDQHKATVDVDNQDTSHTRTTEPQIEDGVMVYASVDKKKSASTDELRQPKLPVVPDREIPPPLPKRPVFDEQMKKAHSTEDVLHGGSEQKPKKSGLKLFKRKHRRQLSDGNLAHIAETANKSDHLEPSSCEGKPRHRRSKSQADITEHMAAAKAAQQIHQNYAEITIPGAGEKPPVRAYLAVDIIQPPPMPEELARGNSGDGGDGDLPEGWKEVQAENGTYFWHVASGTTQWDRPQVAPRPKKKSPDDAKPDETVEQQKVLSFPVHSMGWIELEENKVAPHNMSETISECISILATKRHDLWNTALTWGEGKDIRLLLEGDTLKLLDPKAKVTLLVQPVSKMRVWGVGKEDHRDFAYIARDPNTSRHKCHMFRCHGNVSGRAITGALHELCSKILEEKKRAQEVAKTKGTQQKPWSDILNTPPSQSVRENVGFNEKPLKESKRSFSAKYVGSTDVPKPTGIDVLHRAINKVASRGANWSTVLIEITVSSVKVTDCVSQEVISDDRVRFLSFMGVGKDERLCGYVVHSAQEKFTCRVYQCLPNAATLTKAMEEACQLRYQKCVDAHPELVEKMSREQEQEKLKEKEREKQREKEKVKEKEKDKGGFVTSMQGFLGKLGQKKGSGKKDDGSSSSGKVSGGRVIVPTHTFMVKYYGALPVAVGTGIETVEEAAKHLAGGTLLVCQLDVALNGVTLYDSQRSALSRRHFDADTISYCGLTRTHFGLIQSMGGGKYICHVFAEYKTKAGPIVAAIHETM